MKSIRYIFSTILLLLGASSASAQIIPVWWGPVTVDGKQYGPICWSVDTSARVNTPVGNPVPVLKWDNGDWTQTQKNDLKNGYMKVYNGLIFESEATTMYNCHAYAWAGGTTYWMNQPNQAQYWNEW